MGEQQVQGLNFTRDRSRSRTFKGSGAPYILVLEAGAGNYRLELLLEIKIESRQDARKTTTTTGCSKPRLLVKIDKLKVEGLTLAGQRAEGGCPLLSVRSSQEIPLIIPRLQHVFLSSFRTLHLLD
ncbi:hypothetical protein R1flu_011084 [Riccia fluitans]|uniref:Uncharacterized protein n=1 Tax=Riccia fluitans TaxID=41844 RepID=A0ABD1Z6T9_9MARC